MQLIILVPCDRAPLYSYREICHLIYCSVVFSLASFSYRILRSRLGLWYHTEGLVVHHLLNHHTSLPTPISPVWWCVSWASSGRRWPWSQTLAPACPCGWRTSQTGPRSRLWRTGRHLHRKYPQDLTDQNFTSKRWSTPVVPNPLKMYHQISIAYIYKTPPPPRLHLWGPDPPVWETLINYTVLQNDPWPPGLSWFSRPSAPCT